MLVGYEPESRGKLDWPIYIEPPWPTPHRVRLLQEPGDMLLFKGRVIPHWRASLRAASRSMHVFFHFVPADFAGSLD